MALTALKWSVDDYHRLIEAGILDDRRIELLDGQIVPMSPESPDHYYHMDTAAGYLRQVLGSAAHVRVNGPITLATSEPEPDIAVVADLGRVYATRHPGPDDIKLLIEFARTSLSRDTEEKRIAYAKANIPEYWVVNMHERTIIVYREPSNGSYQVRDQFRSGTISPPSLGSIDIEVDRLI